MIDRKDIRVRDPYIVVYNDKYYMYVTTGEKSLSYYYSTDLDNWELGGVCFEIPEDSWAFKDVWAAEVHKYNDKFYMFVSLLAKEYPQGTLGFGVDAPGCEYSKGGFRATQVAVADTPEGPFIPIVNNGVTPGDRSCIDGSLYVDNGVPYLFYSRDWVQHYVESEKAYIGEIWCAKLTDDLSSMIGEPFRVFASNEAPLSKERPDRNPKFVRYGSDAPFVQKLSGGSLFLTWSPYLDDHYVVLGAVSKSGKVDGEWTHLDTPVFENDGGHAMFFTDLEGRLCMCLHAPEKWTQERAHIFEMEECGGVLKIVKEL